MRINTEILQHWSLTVRGREHFHSSESDIWIRLLDSLENSNNEPISGYVYLQVLDLEQGLFVVPTDLVFSEPLYSFSPTQDPGHNIHNYLSSVEYLAQTHSV